MGLQAASPAWYQQLTGHLTEVQGECQGFESVVFPCSREFCAESEIPGFFMKWVARFDSSEERSVFVTTTTLQIGLEFFGLG
jgi:hypothetical protein